MIILCLFISDNGCKIVYMYIYRSAHVYSTYKYMEMFQ